VLRRCSLKMEQRPMKPPIQIALSEPYPLLDPGAYIAICSEADFAWARLSAPAPDLEQRQ
jgi:hypothetical protein